MSGTHRSGRRREPVETRLARGTVKPDEVTWVVDKVDAEPPEPARPLQSVGRNLWDWAWTHGPWLKPADAELLLMTCELADERVVWRTRSFRDAQDTTPEGERKAWRASVQARHCEDRISSWLGRLGFDPDARARMNLAVASAVSHVSRATGGNQPTFYRNNGRGAFVEVDEEEAMGGA